MFKSKVLIYREYLLNVYYLSIVSTITNRMFVLILQRTFIITETSLNTEIQI